MAALDRVAGGVKPTVWLPYERPASQTQQRSDVEAQLRRTKLHDELQLLHNRPHKERLSYKHSGTLRPDG